MKAKKNEKKEYRRSRRKVTRRRSISRQRQKRSFRKTHKQKAGSSSKRSFSDRMANLGNPVHKRQRIVKRRRPVRDSPLSAPSIVVQRTSNTFGLYLQFQRYLLNKGWEMLDSFNSLPEYLRGPWPAEEYKEGLLINHVNDVQNQIVLAIKGSPRFVRNIIGKTLNTAFKNLRAIGYEAIDSVRHEGLLHAVQAGACRTASAVSAAARAATGAAAGAGPRLGRHFLDEWNNYAVAMLNSLNSVLPQVSGDRNHIDQHFVHLMEDKIFERAQKMTFLDNKIKSILASQASGYRVAEEVLKGQVQELRQELTDYLNLNSLLVENMNQDNRNTLGKYLAEGNIELDLGSLLRQEPRCQREVATEGIKRRFAKELYEDLENQSKRRKVEGDE